MHKQFEFDLKVTHRLKRACAGRTTEQGDLSVTKKDNKRQKRIEWDTPKKRRVAVNGGMKEGFSKKVVSKDWSPSACLECKAEARLPVRGNY